MQGAGIQAQLRRAYFDPGNHRKHTYYTFAKIKVAGSVYVINSSYFWHCFGINNTTTYIKLKI
jgi:hypothetical protein